MDLEQYYRRYSAGQIIKTLNDLLDRELGQRWYELTTPLTCFFAAEYGPHIVEHLRLKLHALWTEDHPPPTKADYQRVEVDAIPHEYETIQPGTILSINGLVVARIKHGEVKLQDPDDQGIVVRVELDSESTVIQRPNLGDRVSARGEVLYNRRGRLEHIVHAAFPNLLPGVESECIQLPDVPRVYPNPLRVYRKILGRALKGRTSYVHGDLHLRNVLVGHLS